jgi:tripartite ATP-independent transporter DctM subunit
MGLALAVTWWLVTRSSAIASLPRRSWREAGKSMIDAGLALMLPVMIIGGLKGGVFTPTEAAVVAAVYSILVGSVIYRELTPAALYQCFLASIRTTAAVMFLVAASTVAAYMIAIADIPSQIKVLLAPFSGDRILLMTAMMVLVVVVGTALDFIPTILILTPILMPIVKQAGIDPVYFGVLFIMNNAIGLITPPVGTVLNVVAAVARIDLGLVIRGVTPFLIAQLIVLALLVALPALVTVPARWFYQ